MAEGTSEKSTKPKKKLNKLRLSKKGIAVIAGSVVLITAVSAKVIHYNNYERPIDINSSVSYLIENDCTTTILEHSSKELIDEVNFLDGASSVYTKLNSLNLSPYDKGMERVTIYTIDEKEIDCLISKFKKLKRGDIKTPSNDSIEFYNVVNTLLSYKEALTEQRFIDGVNYINEFSNIVLNSIICDTLDSDMSYYGVKTNLDDMSASKLQISYITDVNFEITTSYFCNLRYFAKELRELNNLREKYSNGEVSIKKLIEKENEMIQFIKTCIVHDYSINNGKIHQEENNSDVKKKVKVN